MILPKCISKQEFGPSLFVDKILNSSMDQQGNPMKKPLKEGHITVYKEFPMISGLLLIEVWT